MRPKIESVEALSKYKLHVVFKDGVKGVLDLWDCAGKGVFKSWDDNENFFNVFISPESGAITWPNEIDIDTYNAYCTIKGISPEQYFEQTETHAKNF